MSSATETPLLLEPTPPTGQQNRGWWRMGKRRKTTLECRLLIFVSKVPLLLLIIVSGCQLCELILKPKVCLSSGRACWAEGPPNRRRGWVSEWVTQVAAPPVTTRVGEWGTVDANGDGRVTEENLSYTHEEYLRYQRTKYNQSFSRLGDRHKNPWKRTLGVRISLRTSGERIISF